MKTLCIVKWGIVGLLIGFGTLQAQDIVVSHVSADLQSTEAEPEDLQTPKEKSRLTVGGYGEAVYTRNFYSDNMFRYSHADR